MKNQLLRILFFLSLAFIHFGVNATPSPNNPSINGSNKVILNAFSEVPAFCNFKAGQEPDYNAFFRTFISAFHFASGNELKWLRNDTDQLGMVHHRFIQTYKNISIENTMYIFHTFHGKLKSMNGLLYPQFEAPCDQLLTKESAIQNALKLFPSEKYMWEDSASEAMLKSQFEDPNKTYFPSPELVFAAPDNDLDPNHYTLTYKMDLYSVQPLFRKYVYIEVQSGSPVLTRERIHTSDTLVTAVTALSGTKRITADMVSANSFRLREVKRGKGIETYNLQKGTNYGNAVDFTDTDTTWNNVNANLDQYATDAHFGAEVTYDFYKLKFNRNSIDNSGLKLLSYIHYSTNYVNAFWDGTRMTYGDGNASYKPLVSLDITGHEITHGLTSYTSNLNYSYESGALNESYSDILGTAIEWYGDSSRFEWDLGKKIGTAFRSMSNPKTFGDPDTYKGTNWYTGAADNGGVHTNSGVQNYWFYTLCVGDTGTNDLGNKYDVDSIGMEKAAAIAYRTLTYYLTSTSQYADARTYSLQAAEDLYGACSYEQVAVAKAWYAVGIGSMYNDIQFAQPNTSIVTKGSIDNDIYRVLVTPACTGTSTDTLKYIKFTSAGSTRTGIITKASLYSTGNSKTFSTATLFGSVNNPSDTFVISGTKALAQNENYFWLTYDVSSSANTGDSLDAVCLEVQTDSNSTFNGVVSGFRKIGLCTPPASSSACTYMYTSKVVIDSINNSSGCSSTSYSDFTNKSTSAHPGDTLNYSITFNSYNQYLTIWIDANNDGKYSTSEKVVTNQQSSSFISSGKLVVPVGISLGNHIIRVKADYNAISNDSIGCGQLTYGETEDYLLKVIKSPDMTYSASYISQNVQNVSKSSVNNQVIGLRIVTLNSNSPLVLRSISASARGTTDTNDIRNMRIWYTGSSSSFTTTKSFGNTCANPGIKSYTFNDSLPMLRGNNYIWLSMDVDSGAIMGDSIDAAILSFSFDSATYTPDTTDPAGKRRIDYCTPIGGANNNYNVTGYEFGIKKVALNSISNTSGVPSSSGTFYNNYTNISTILSAGSNYTLSITPGSSAATYTQASIGWIDWNNDGRFDTTEEIGRNFNHTGVVNFSVQVKGSQKPGKFRMRLMSGYGYYYNTGAMTFDPCYIRNPSSNTDISECEDYMIWVYPAVPAPSINPNTTVNICLGDTVLFSTGLDTSYNYNWYSDTTIIYSGKGLAADSFAFVPTTAGIYKIKVKAIDSYAQSGTSAQVTVNVSAPATVGTISLSSDSVCKGSIVTFITAGSNGSLSWQQNTGSGWTSTGLTNDTVSFYPAVQTSYRLISISGVCKNDTSAVKNIYIKSSPLKGTITGTSNNICSGANVILTLNNYQGNITWISNNGSGWNAISGAYDTLQVSPVLSTSYRAVSYTSACGTDTSAAFVINVSQPSKAGTISPSSNTVCSGKNLILTLTGRVGVVQWQYNNGASWTNAGITKDTAQFNPTAATNYRTISTSGVCPADTSSIISITVNPNPVKAQLTASKSAVCQGDSVMLYATGYTGTIQWQLNSGAGYQNITSNGDSMMAHPLTGYIYRTISMTGSCGNDTSSPFQIQVNPLPVAGTLNASSQRLCYGDSLFLDANNAVGQIQWYIYSGTSWTNTGLTGSTLKTKLYNSTTFRAVAVTSTCGLDSSASISISVLPQVLAGNIASSRNAVCSGDSTTLKLSGYSGQIQWWMNNGSGWSQLTDTLTQIITRPTVQTIYRSVSFVTGCGADTGNQITIYINPGPKVGNTALSLSQICEGDSVNLSLKNNSGSIVWEQEFSGVWSAISGTNNIIRIAPASGTQQYRAKVSNACGYIYSDTATIKVDERPLATQALLSDTGVCNGSGVTLTAANGYKGTVTWQYLNGNNWINLGVIGSPAQYIPLNNMTIRATMSNGVCPTVSTAGVSLQVYPVPSAQLNPTGLQTICEGDSVQLKSINPALKTEWFRNNILFNSGVNQIWAKTAGDYQLVQANSYGCKDSSAYVNIVVNPLPDTPVVTLDQNVKNRLRSSANKGNQWYLNGLPISGATANYWDPLQVGDYTVMVTDSNGCRSVGSSTYTFYFAGFSSVSTYTGKMKLYPNPTSGMIRLEFLAEAIGSEWVIYDLSGKSCLRFSIGNLEENYDLSNLESGVYIGRVMGAETLNSESVRIVLTK